VTYVKYNYLFERDLIKIKKELIVKYRRLFIL